MFYTHLYFAQHITHNSEAQAGFIPSGLSKIVKTGNKLKILQSVLSSIYGFKNFLKLDLSITINKHTEICASDTKDVLKQLNIP